MRRDREGVVIAAPRLQGPAGMSQRLLLWLNAPEHSWLDPSDTPLAMATLLVQIVERDLRAVGLGSDAVDAVLARRFDLTQSEAAELRQSCRQVLARAPAPDLIAQLVRRYVPEPERSAMVEAAAEAWAREDKDAVLTSLIGEQLGVRLPQTPRSGP